jgi:hypothetical protein
MIISDLDKDTALLFFTRLMTRYAACACVSARVKLACKVDHYRTHVWR